MRKSIAQKDKLFSIIATTIDQKLQGELMKLLISDIEAAIKRVYQPIDVTVDMQSLQMH